jgi:hypothetical protein
MQFAEMGYSAFEAWATGSMKAKDAVKQLALQLAEAAIQGSLFGQGAFGGMSKGGGVFGRLIGGLFGGVSAGIYHSGGVVGSGGASRAISPAAFSNAPRYHEGGVAGLKSGEVPAILQKGEVVIPRGGSLGGGSPTFAPNIIIQGNADRNVIKSALDEAQKRWKAELPSLMKQHSRAGRI